MELQKMLEAVAFRSYSDDLTMYEACLVEYPDMILSLSDDYMASLILKMSEQYRNILVLCGYGQTRSIPHYLYFSH